MVDSKFFGIPFATSGDKALIPEDVQPSGAISYQQGYGPDYERDPETDPLAKRVPRDETNELYYQITLALKYLQLYGVPEWYAVDDNGDPVAYPLAAQVRHDAGSGMRVWRSIAATNTATPGSDPTKWTAAVPAFSTQPEAEAGTSDDTIMSPLRTSQQVTARIASEPEARAGASNSVLMTPLQTLHEIDEFALLLTGGTVTGPITLPGPPTEDLHATTRAYVDHPGFVSVTAAVTLTQAQLRKYVEVSGAASYTIGLPAPNSATTTGGYYLIYNASSSNKTLSTPSGNFVGPNGTNASTMSLPRGAFVWVMAGFDNWVVLAQTYSYTLLGSATTLTPSALGGYVQLGGATTYTVNLPNPASFSGASLEIYNSGSIGYTLSTPGGNFVGPEGTDASTKVIMAGQYLMLRAGSVNWIAH